MQKAQPGVLSQALWFPTLYYLRSRKKFTKICLPKIHLNLVSNYVLENVCLYYFTFFFIHCSYYQFDNRLSIPTWDNQAWFSARCVCEERSKIVSFNWHVAMSIENSFDYWLILNISSHYGLKYFLGRWPWSVYKSQLEGTQQIPFISGSYNWSWWSFCPKFLQWLVHPRKYKSNKYIYTKTDF